MKKKTLIFACILILFAAFSRLLPHPPNFTPIIAMGLFGGAYFNKKTSLIIPLIAMFLADFALQIGFWLNLRAYSGFHSSMIAVYACIAIIGILGWQLKDKISIKSVGIYSIIASILFFVFTNFSVWLVGGFYPLNLAGLMACFTAAIPFLGNTLISSIAYSALLFGAFEYYKNAQTEKSIA